MLGLTISGNEVEFLLVADKSQIADLPFQPKEQCELWEHTYSGTDLQPDKLPVRIFSLGKLDASSGLGRSRLVVWSINAYRILLSLKKFALVDWTYQSEQAEVRQKRSLDGAVSIEKTLGCDSVQFSKLRALYSALETSRETETRTWDWCLVAAQPDSTKKVISITPVGYHDVQPWDEDELKFAIRCVLRALSVLHYAKIAHCDIRWPNIILAFKPRRWVLIDLEYMQEFGKLPAALKQHPPRAGEFASAAYDMWLVGKLLESLHRFQLSPEAIAFGQCMTKADPAERPALEDALDHPWLRGARDPPCPPSPSSSAP